MEDKVFVTGAGIISALGVGSEATLQSLLSGGSGIGRITHLETEHDEFPVGEVALSNAEMSRMLNVGYPIDSLRTVLMGIIAAKEAVASSKLLPRELRTAAFISGTTVGGMDKTERHFKTVFDSNTETEDSYELKYNDCGYSTELIADSVGKFSLVTTTSTACSSAANAIILGANLIKSGIVDIAIAGGSEALTKFHLNGFNTLMILDKDNCRPFDRDRTGINLGEGAAYIVLESEKSAKARGAEVLGILSGYANTCDAFHQTASSENGEGAYLAMRKAMDMARLSPRDIDYINAHGTGTPNNDETELAAMQRIWDYELPKFSSTKAFTGHTTSASGSIEAVICLLALRHGFLPQNLGWKNPIKDDAIPVLEKCNTENVENIINNSFGFGGNDSTLIFSKFHKDNG
ncbi:beta-ketoacyl-[acyl-carrier-protein] synthase family protein [Muribaculum caecicola]|uniref:Beta-ketoacyl-[acyl-carrier-protein] synthase family protein n=1 Tax=Muribaculum caecicola TaxID=3038144 RepID=A0AC61S8Q9_9BACT|nr:beta-ketoacyl-[acyl-carrier-protein] synthase family protein [Muribaculum caecicola]THG55069.1 beta-ketoacyl-[acyl-carrier-protein] synthase family protein [Muribaculum caecicola]